MADENDFYSILGVPRDADQKQIQRQYRKLARQYHPDFNKEPEAEARFKEISEAYDVLSNPRQRKKYDAFGADFRHVPDDVDPDEWARAQAAGRSRGHSRGPGDGDPFAGFGGFGSQGGGFSTDGEDIDLDDLLGGMFGGRGRRSDPVAGADQEYEIELPVVDAYRGTKRQLSMQGPEGTRTVDVTIPAGVSNGTRIRLAGQGGQGLNGGPRGDLYLIVRLAQDGTFRVEGKDIHVTLPIGAPLAALGGPATCPTPGGSIRVTVPPLSSSGRKLRLKGRGMPSRKGTAGDLYAEISIVMPRSLSDEDKELYRRLAQGSATGPANTEGSAS